MNRAIVKVAPPLIEDCLFGGSVRVVGARDRAQDGTIEFIIEGDQLPPSPAEGVLPVVTCVITVASRKFEFK